MSTCPRTNAVVKPLIPPPTMTESSTLLSSTGATVGVAVELELAESRIPRNLSLLGPRTTNRPCAPGALTFRLLHETGRWDESASIVENFTFFLLTDLGFPPVGIDCNQSINRWDTIRRPLDSS